MPLLKGLPPHTAPIVPPPKDDTAEHVHPHPGRSGLEQLNRSATQRTIRVASSVPGSADSPMKDRDAFGPAPRVRYVRLHGTGHAETWHQNSQERRHRDPWAIYFRYIPTPSSAAQPRHTSLEATSLPAIGLP